MDSIYCVSVLFSCTAQLSLMERLWRRFQGKGKKNQPNTCYALKLYITNDVQGVDEIGGQTLRVGSTHQYKQKSPDKHIFPIFNCFIDITDFVY